MKSSIVALFVVVGLVSAGLFLLPPGISTSEDSGLSERWLSVNHLQLQVDGEWEDVKLMPLADHLCRSNDPIYTRYCEPK